MGALNSTGLEQGRFGRAGTKPPLFSSKMHDYNPFKFDVAAELFEKRNSRGETEMWIGGICTTDHMDQEGETLLQDGLDFGPFLDGGWLNDNHDKKTGAAVGIPTSVSLRQLPNGHKGHYIEGKLLDNDRAKEIRSLAESLERSGDGKRQLGFSVEGNILERDPSNPKLVRRAVVREVAITRCPVNPHTSLQRLAKSLSAGTPGASSGPGDGGALQPEALEGVSPQKKKRRFTKAQAISFLMSRNGKLTRKGAEAIVDYAFRHYA